MDCLFDYFSIITNILELYSFIYYNVYGGISHE